MQFTLEVNTGGRELTDMEKQELARDVPRIRIELKRRFSAVSCPEHGAPEALVTVLDLKEFPNVAFSFSNICCDVYNLKLLDAAKA